mmetsp:Transcript_8118/g.20290  ORF Transcript_8118/g.20290 Transcript_8118/m.20290 type:complete len:206 (-) Transcript_8118:1590-2207(-)
MGTRDLCHERVGGVPEERELQQDISQELEGQILLHGRRELLERGWRHDPCFLLAELPLYVELDAPLEFRRDAPTVHEIPGLPELRLEFVFEHVLEHLGHGRHHEAKEHGAHEHAQRSVDAAVRAARVDVAIPHSGHRRDDPIHVGNVLVLNIRVGAHPGQWGFSRGICTLDLPPDARHAVGAERQGENNLQRRQSDVPDLILDPA